MRRTKRKRPYSGLGSDTRKSYDYVFFFQLSILLNKIKGWDSTEGYELKFFDLSSDIKKTRAPR